MKKFIRLSILALFIGFLPFSAYADGPLSIDVPNSCTITDTNGVSHSFPQNDSPSQYLGICMLQAAKGAGLIDFTLTNDPSFGLYIQSVNGTNPGATEYWAIWNNGTLASCGIGCIPLSQGDTLSLILTDWSTNVESTTVALHVHSLLSPPSPASKGGGGGIPNSQVNVGNALSYLASNQHEDGSFGPLFLSDWVAIAFSAIDPSGVTDKLRAYMRTATPELSVVTEYERHAMALLALGINPYTDTPADYITPIVNAFDGTQIGNASLDNDDIFALFPLLHAGYTVHDVLIQKITAFILSQQRQDGSWDESADMTAAAIQTLIPIRMLPDVSTALIRAEGYLRREQPAVDGSGNSFSVSWVRQAVSALSWTPSGWMPNLFTQKDYLAELQQSDGGIEPESSGIQTRVWATAYAIPAALGKSWPQLLQSFPKQEIQSISTSTPSVLIIAPSATIVATTSPTPVRYEKSKPKLPVATPLPLSMPELQTAAVANAPATGVFFHLWNAIASFFIKLL